jgi:flagellar biosynthesis chaperone FliJ
MVNMQQQIEALEKTIEQLNQKVSYLERVVEKLIDTAWVKEEKIDSLQSKLSDYE